MIRYGSQYVDEKYVSAIEPNLYTDTVLIPGVTYTDKYEEGAAGGLYVHQLGKGTAVAVKTPGQDFVDEAAADTLIPILFNNNLQKSRKIYGVQAAAVAFAAGEEYLADALNQVKEARQYAALACLAKEGTDLGDTTAITATNAVGYITKMRKAVKDAHGKANFMLVSTEVYATLLGVLGLQSFADPSVVSGEMMKRFGLNIIECNSFDEAAVVYNDKTGTQQTVDLTGVDMICGYNEAFSVIDNFNMYRLIDSENFAGTKAQVEENVALTVNSPAQIIVKFNK